MRPPSLPLPFPPPSALVAGVVGWGHDWQRLKAIPIKWVRVAPFEGGGGGVASAAAISASREKSKMHLTKTAIVNIGLRKEERRQCVG